MNRTLVLVLALVIAAAAAALAGQTQASLIVAYMASNGELVPIARYDGTRWRNTWPEPIQRDAPLPVRTVGDIPRAWLGQPVPLTWTAWSHATRKQQRVTVTGVDREGACVEAITLATSFRPDPPSDGLAFDRPTTVEAILQMEQSSPEGDVLRRDVARHFRMAIDKAVLPESGREQDEIGSAVLALARADKSSAASLAVQSAYRTPRSRVFFIETEREFGGIAADAGYDALSYGGWFRRDRSGALIPSARRSSPSPRRKASCHGIRRSGSFASAGARSGQCRNGERSLRRSCYSKCPQRASGNSRPPTSAAVDSCRSDGRSQRPQASAVNPP